MFDAFVATFLEGLEAFLVVAVALAFFRKSRRGVVAAAQLGLGVSVGASVTFAWLLSGAENPTRVTWLLAVAAAAVVTLLAADVWRAARRMAAERNGLAVEEHPSPSGAAWLAVFLGTVLLVSRSGMMSVLLFGSLIFQIGAVGVTAAAACGTAAAALLSWQWSRHAHRLPTRTVVTVTATVVLIFLSHLVISDILGLWQNRLWPLL
jgi:high-affinity iron transporter